MAAMEPKKVPMTKSQASRYEAHQERKSHAGRDYVVYRETKLLHRGAKIEGKTPGEVDEILDEEGLVKAVFGGDGRLSNLVRRLFGDERAAGYQAHEPKGDGGHHENGEDRH